MVTNLVKKFAAWVLRYDLHRMELTLSEARAQAEFWRREADKRAELTSRLFVNIRDARRILMGEDGS